MPKKRNDTQWSGGAAGLQASVIGFVLVGCTAVGFGIGWWLDSKFNTTFWMPLFSMIGVAAGFMQMFRMIGEINREQQDNKAWQTREDAEVYAAHPSIAPPKPQEKPLFRVPPPPSASWDKKAEEPEPEDEPYKLDTAALIDKWLSEDDEDEKDATT